MDFYFNLILILAIISMFAWLFALVDVARSNFKTDNEKLFWMLLIVFAGVIGAVIYFCIGKANRKPNGFQ